MPPSITQQRVTVAGAASAGASAGAAVVVEAAMALGTAGGTMDAAAVVGAEGVALAFIGVKEKVAAAAAGSWEMAEEEEEERGGSASGLGSRLECVVVGVETVELALEQVGDVQVEAAVRQGEAPREREGEVAVEAQVSEDAGWVRAVDESMAAAAVEAEAEAEGAWEGAGVEKSGGMKAQRL